MVLQRPRPSQRRATAEAARFDPAPGEDMGLLQKRHKGCEAQKTAFRGVIPPLLHGPACDLRLSQIDNGYYCFEQIVKLENP
jgi:hypothetical protein